MTNDTYYIRGTIAVRVNCADRAGSQVVVTPSVGFLTPDKSQAIAFPVPQTDGKKKLDADAWLIELCDKKTCTFDAKVIKPSFLPALLSIAGQQKPIELHVAKNTEAKASEPEFKITGFVYPAAQ